MALQVLFKSMQFQLMTGQIRLRGAELGEENSIAQ